MGAERKEGARKGVEHERVIMFCGLNKLHQFRPALNDPFKIKVQTGDASSLSAFMLSATSSPSFPLTRYLARRNTP